MLPVVARPARAHARLGEAAQVEDGLDARQPRDGDEEVELAGAVLQVDPEVVGAVALQAGEVDRASEMNEP